MAKLTVFRRDNDTEQHQISEKTLMALDPWGSSRGTSWLVSERLDACDFVTGGATEFWDHISVMYIQHTSSGAGSGYFTTTN